MSINNIIGKLFKRFGYTIYNCDTYRVYRNHAFLLDIKKLAKEKERPVVFDVGANKGQTIEKFRKHIPGSVIYSFEPGPTAFNILKSKYTNRLENIALGSTIGKIDFFENEHLGLSSILEQGGTPGKIINKHCVEMTTVDEYCRVNNIDRIDVLKSDTQGYDFEVLKGACRMMRENKINLVYFEFILEEQYKALPSFADILKFLEERNFRLVNFYMPYFDGDGLLAFGDVMLVNKMY